MDHGGAAGEGDTGQPMAMTPRDIPISREDVYNWIAEWNATDKSQSIEDFISAKVADLGLEDEMVNTLGSDALGDETHIADMIIADLLSYSNYAPSS